MLTIKDGDKNDLKYLGRCYDYLLDQKFEAEDRINGLLTAMRPCADEVVYLSLITKRMIDIDDLRTAIVNPNQYSPSKLIQGYPLNLWEDTVKLIGLAFYT